MLYELLKFGHLIGLILIGAGLIGVFLSDIRTREAKTLPVFAEACATSPCSTMASSSPARCCSSDQGGG